MTLEDLVKHADLHGYGGVAFWQRSEDAYLCCLLDNMFEQVSGSIPWKAKRSIDECIAHIVEFMASRIESPSC
jgi:hypothetical protein